MSCNVQVLAKNKQPSILFRRLYDYYKNLDAALTGYKVFDSHPLHLLQKTFTTFDNNQEVSVGEAIGYLNTLEKAETMDVAEKVGLVSQTKTADGKRQFKLYPLKKERRELVRKAVELNNKLAENGEYRFVARVKQGYLNPEDRFKQYQSIVLVPTRNAEFDESRIIEDTEDLLIFLPKDKKPLKREEKPISENTPIRTLKRIARQRLREVDALIKAGSDSDKVALEVRKQKLLDVISSSEESLRQYVQAEVTEQNFLETVENFGKEEVEHVERLLKNKKDLTDQEINSAIKILNLWSSASEVFVENLSERPEAFKELEKDATSLRQLLDEKIYEKNLENAKKSGFDLVLDELKTFVTSGARNYVLDIVSSKNRFIQYVGNLIQSTKRDRDLFLRERVKKLNELANKLSKEQLNKIYQRDSDGNILYNAMVHKISQKYYDEKARLFEKIRTAENDDARIKAKKQLYAMHIMVNLNEQKDGLVESDMAVLKNQGFTEDDISEIIEESKNLYKKYITDRDAYEVHLKALHGSDTDTINEKLKEWVKNNDPDLYQDKDKGADYIGYKYRSLVPKKIKKTGKGKNLKTVSTEYYDQNYNEILQDEDLFAFYTYVKESIEEMKMWLPDYATQHTADNFIYRAKADMIEAYQNGGFDAFISQFSEEMKESVTSSYAYGDIDMVDPLTGKPVKNIPIQTLVDKQKQLNRLKRTKANHINKGETKIANSHNKEIEKLEKEIATKYSSDPVKSMEVFMGIATNYRFMSAIYDKVSIANEVVRNAKIDAPVFATEVGIEQEKQAVQHAIDSALFNEHVKKTDPKSPAFKSKEEKKKLKELEEYLEKHEEKFYMLYDQGITNKGKSNKFNRAQKEFYNNYAKKLKEYSELRDRGFTFGSITNTAIRLTQAKALAFNPLSGIANVLFGKVSNMIHSFGNLDFNFNDYLKANSIIMNSTLKYGSFGMLENPTSKKVANILDKFGVLGDIIAIERGESEFKKDTLLTKFRDAPYTFMQSSDFHLKAETIIAMMLNEKIKTESGEISLWEAFDEEGNWIGPENIDWDGDITSDSEMNKFKSFRNKAIQVTKIIHGNFDPNSSVLARRTAIGRLLSQFKLSWMAEGIYARFGEETWNEVLGRKTKGRYITGYEFIKNSIMDLSFKSQYQELDEVDKANLKMLLGELSLMLTMYGAIAILKGFYDDDEDNKGLKFAVNLIQRVNSDIAFYVSPQIFESVTQRVVPASSLFTDATRAVSSTYKYVTDDDYKGNTLLKWTRVFPYTSNINRFVFYTEKELADLQN